MNSRFSLTNSKLKKASARKQLKPQKKPVPVKHVEKKQPVVLTSELSRSVPPPPPEEPKTYAKYEGKEPRLGTETIKQITHKAKEEITEPENLVETYEKLAKEYSMLLETRDKLRTDCDDLENSITEAKKKQK